MATRIATETGSVYEVDRQAKLVRRLSGRGNPTQRVGTDGEWKPYANLAFEPQVGSRLWIVWSYGDGADGSDRCTVTSTVTEIVEEK